jgi:fucose permease
LLGTAWSALVNAVNAIVPPTFGGSMVYATNLSNVFFGLGAFLTPMGLAFLLRRWSLPALLSALAAVVIIPAVLSVTVDFAHLFAQETATILAEPSEMGAWAMLYNPVVWLASLAFLFYAPLEAAMGAWSTTFMAGRGVDEGTALRWLSAFWLSYMLTRLLAALSLPEGGEAMAVLVLSILAVGAMAAFVWSRSRGSAVATVAGAGFIFGPIFPTILAILLASVTLPVRGRAIGLFFAVGAVGWTLIPTLIGNLAKKTDIQRGFIIAVGSALALVIMALLLVLQLGF